MAPVPKASFTFDIISIGLALLSWAGSVEAITLRGIFDTLVVSSGEELRLTRNDQGWYTVDVSIGGQLTHLAVDTGSSMIWARSNSSESTSSIKDMGKRSLHHRLSVADIFSVTRRFSAQYGRGSVRGAIFDEAVRFGRSPSDDVERTTMSCAVGRVTSASSFWARQRSIDGVFGLACTEADAAGLACAVSGPVHGHASQRVFTLQMNDEGGTLSLGFIPPQHLATLHYMPISSHGCGHWTAPLLSLSVSTTSKETVVAQTLLRGRLAEAILDSGSDGIVGPTFAVIRLARLLGASPAPAGEGYGAEVTFYTVPCAAAITLPEVSLTLGEAPGVTVTLTGKALVSLGRGEGNSTETCHLRLAGWETQSWILGRAFLTQLKAAVFDIDKKRVAIAI